MRNTREQYVREWSAKTDRSEREVYVPEALREPVRPLVTGDRIRILRDNLDSAQVSVGDVLTVLDVSPYSFETDAPTLCLPGGTWTFGLDDEGIGWERA